jgi:dTDP-4-amino-4,6-dideoxygalactose transaminase
VIIAIKALNLIPGSRIGVPLYCCPVVFKAIKAAGCSPQFLDVDPKTYCLALEDLERKQPKLDALIAVHMFGHLCDMPGILGLLKGKPLIEDCAQSLGSQLNGQPCGTFGDISFFSFRSGKYLSVGEGGALYSDRSDLRARIAEIVKTLPAPRCDEEMKHVILTCLKSKLRNRPWWGLLGSRIWAHYNKKTEFVEKSPVVLGRIFVSDIAIVRERARHFDSMIASQRAHANYYEHNLHLENGMLCPERPGTRYNQFQYPITFRTINDRDSMAAYLGSRGIGTSKPYEDAAEGAARHYGYIGDCSVSEKLLKRTLTIPCYHKLAAQDIKYIAKSLNQGWALIEESRGSSV